VPCKTCKPWSLPEHTWATGSKVVTVPSEWVARLYRNALDQPHLPLRVAPFGVESNRFVSRRSTPRDTWMLYVKHRHPKVEEKVRAYLKDVGVTVETVRYGHYREEDYLQLLRRCRGAVWLAASESQGFAQLEAWSCDVPTLVCDVKTWGEEYHRNTVQFTPAPQVPATGVPYWSNQCGERLTKLQHFPLKWKTFVSRLTQYTPRRWVLQRFNEARCLRYLVEG